MSIVWTTILQKVASSRYEISVDAQAWSWRASNDSDAKGQSGS